MAASFHEADEMMMMEAVASAWGATIFFVSAVLVV
jgi:hypothetical protein